MKSSYIHNGTAWSRILAPFVNDGTSYKQPNKVYTHDGTAWKLVYDTGYKKILTAGNFPDKNNGVVWSGGLAFVNFYTSYLTNIFHYDGSNTIRLGPSTDTFHTDGGRDKDRGGIYFHSRINPVRI
jgi:hypothetical protein